MRDIRWVAFRDEVIRICEHMGLKTTDVVSIDIHIRVGEPVRVNVHMIPSETTARDIGDALETISFEQKSP